MRVMFHLLLACSVFACQAPQRHERRPYTYSVDYAATDEQRDLIHAAYAAWASATGANFIEVSEHGIVSIVAEEPDPRDGEAFGRTTWFSADGHLVSATIQLSPSRLLAPFDTIATWNFIFQPVIQHEIGHTLSLQHSNKCHETMWPSTGDGCQPETLSEDAIAKAIVAIQGGWIQP